MAILRLKLVKGETSDKEAATEILNVPDDD